MENNRDKKVPKYNYWYWHNVYSTDEIRELHKDINDKHDKTSIDNPAKSAVKTSKLKMAEWFDLKDKLCHLEQSLLTVNAENFGFNIWPQYDSQSIILNEYDSKIQSQYDWHKDASDSHVYDMKFTLLVNLSLEPYEGGHFYLFDSNGGEHVKVLDKPGNAIAFISSQFHKVTPVTSGKRHSLTMFYSGPRFI